MADNRIFLVCTCGDYYCVAKQLVEWYTQPSDTWKENFDVWLAAHSFCGPNEKPFHLEYENDVVGWPLERRRRS